MPRQRRQACLRFDYAGHGQSTGAFTDGTIGSWKADAAAMIEAQAAEDSILVGSSMGGWIALLLAMEEAARAKAERRDEPHQGAGADRAGPGFYPEADVAKVLRRRASRPFCARGSWCSQAPMTLNRPSSRAS
jgi:hypothetical protein